MELRKLRLENQRLKERLLLAKLPHDDDDEDEAPRSAGLPGTNSRLVQRRFRTDEPTDSLYFGSPGLASVIADVGKKYLNCRLV